MATLTMLDNDEEECTPRYEEVMVLESMYEKEMEFSFGKRYEFKLLYINTILQYKILDCTIYVKHVKKTEHLTARTTTSNETQRGVLCKVLAFCSQVYILKASW